MTRLTDGNRTVEIKMTTWQNDNWTPDWSNDFFEVGGLAYDEETNSYTVDDVDYCIEQAMDWKNAIGDFAENEPNPPCEDRAVFVVEV